MPHTYHVILIKINVEPALIGSSVHGWGLLINDHCEMISYSDDLCIIFNKNY